MLRLYDPIVGSERLGCGQRIRADNPFLYWPGYVRACSSCRSPRKNASPQGYEQVLTHDWAAFACPGAGARAGRGDLQACGWLSAAWRHSAQHRRSRVGHAALAAVEKVSGWDQCQGDTGVRSHAGGGLRSIARAHAEGRPSGAAGRLAVGWALLLVPFHCSARVTWGPVLV